MILDDLTDFLTAYNAGSLALTLGTNLFLGTMPNAPDDCVVLFETPGSPTMHVMGPNSPDIHQPHIQLIVRDLLYQNGRTVIDNVTNALESIVNETINSVLYQRIEQQQDPFLMSRDAARRFFFGCNFSCMRSAS